MIGRTDPGCRSLAFALALALAGCGDADTERAAQAAAAEEPAAAGAIVAEGEFQTPESVLVDDAAGLYLVSNINGPPTAKDDNGFISRMAPDGTVRQARWIDGAAAAVVLHAPKGLAIRGDSLFVADIDSVRIFHRMTGAALGAWGVEGASFLNDLATGPDGTLYVSDSGLDADFQSTGTDAIYRFPPDGAATVVAAGVTLSRPNGLVASEDGVFFVPFGGNGLHRIDPNGEVTRLVELPAGQLDGLVRLDDGTFLVSSWEAGAVYRVRPGGEVETAVAEVEAPADIGYDARRGRVLVPLFTANRVLGRPIR